MNASTGMVTAAQLAARLGRWNGSGPAAPDESTDTAATAAITAAATQRGTPLHLALANRLTALVLDGRIAVGARLPAERVLSVQLGVSRTTVTAAYALLRESGFAVSRQGSGTYTSLPDRASAHSGGGWSAPGDRYHDHHLDRNRGQGRDQGRDTVGENDLIDLMCATPSAQLPELQAALRHAAQVLPAYSTLTNQPYGLEELREAIADEYERRGVPTTPDQIIVTGGAMGAITLTARLLLSSGDRVLVESPTYPNALDTFRAQQARPVPVPLDEEGWAPGSFESALGQLRARLTYVVPHFQNPTGHVMDPERQASIAHAARRAGSWLLADETMTDTGLDGVYGDGDGSVDAAVASRTDSVGMADAPPATPALPAPPAPPVPFAASVRPADAERLLVCGSLSKSFWGGLRVGWLRGPVRVIHELAAARAALDLASPILDQLVAIALLRGDRTYLDRHRREWREQRNTLIRAVTATFPGWEFRVPAGGLCLWVRMDRDDATVLGHCAQTHGLLVYPGPRFGADPGTFERYLRLPYTLAPERLEEAVRRLALAREVRGQLPSADYHSHLVA